MPDPRSPQSVSRPEAAGYFLDAERGEGLLPWDHVVSAMSTARNYWVATSGADGRPHSMPVWGVWDETWGDAAFVFSTSPATRKAKNLARNPYAVVHLESGARVVVVEGPVREVRERALLERFIELYNPKYAWSFTVDQVSQGGVFAVRPAKAFAWKGDEGEAFSGTATRWIFPAAESET